MILDAGTTVFRRTKEEMNHLKWGRFFWCKLEEPNLYGTWLHEYNMLKPINLIDTSTQEFRDMCKKAIDAAFADEDERDEYYFPFGLGGFARTFRVYETLTIDGRPPKKVDLSKETQYKLFTEFDGCMRSSIHSVDVKFTVFLQNLIGSEYDGYISPAIPSFLHDEFPPEVCLFAPDESIIQHVRSQYSQSGSGIPYMTAEFGTRPIADIDVRHVEPVLEVYETAQFGARKLEGQNGGAKRYGTGVHATSALLGVVALMAVLGGII